MKKYNYTYALVSHMGRVRTENEDNYYVNGITAKDDQVCAGIASDFLRIAVADGMGGMSGGKTASLIALQALNSNKDLADCVFYGSERIYRSSMAIRSKMGSTIAVIDFKGNTASLCNVGDTRIYRLRNDKLEKLSKDHTTIDFLLRSGLITQQEAKDHPSRHQLTQYLGIDPDEIQIEPYTDHQTIENKDRYLICSDGLTDMISDEGIASVLEANKDCCEAVNKLLEKALNVGGYDNITIALIDIREED